MFTLGWVEDNPNELFQLGWYDSGVVVIEDENYFRLYKAPRELEAVDVVRGAIILSPSLTDREEIGVIDMGRLLEISHVDRVSEMVLAERDQTSVGTGTVGYGSDVVFPRGSFTNMQLRIKSSEELGILDSGYVEDYDGVDGYVTLRRVSNDDRTSYPAIALPGETPGIDNDVFQITVPLSSVLNEQYVLEGRVRDLIGNYTIFGAVATPIGGEDVTALTIEIVDGFSVRYVYETEMFSIRPTLEVVLVERGK